MCRTETPDRRRGLCVTDYSRFRSALLQVPPEKRGDFEQLAVNNGRLLSSRQGQRPAIDDDVFADLLKQFRENEDSDDTPPRIVIREEPKGKPKPPDTPENRKKAIRDAFREKKPGKNKPTKKPPKKPKPEDVEKEDE